MNKRSFTLIELLITVGLMSLALALTAGVLGSVVRTDNKQKVLMHIQNSGDSALDVIEENIRKASGITCVESSSGDWGYVPCSSSDATILELHSESYGYKYIGRAESSVVCPNGTKNGYLYIVDSKTEYNDSNGGDEIKLTNDSTSGGINITDFDFAVYGDSSPTRVSVNIKVAEGCSVLQQKEFDTLVTLLGS